MVQSLGRTLTNRAIFVFRVSLLYIQCFFSVYIKASLESIVSCREKCTFAQEKVDYRKRLKIH